MRILVINDKIEGGGVEKVMHDLVLWLERCGENTITVVSMGDERKAFGRLYPRSVKYFPYDMEKPYRFKRFSPRWIAGQFERRLRKLWLMGCRYDVIIAIKEGPAMILAAQLRAKKKYAWIHVDYNYLHWTAGCFASAQKELSCMQQFDSVVCVSEAAADSVRKTVGDPGNLVVRYNPLDYEKIQKLSRAACKEQRPKDRPLFVTIGRITAQKNYLLLADVCAKLEQKYAFELWVVGDGDQREALEKKILQDQITSIKLLGQQENPYPYLAQADWFVSSAQWESFGLAVQEALILEIPVITTECPAIAEVFDSRFGMMCQNTFFGLYDAMEHVLQNAEVGQQFRKEIKKHYQKENLYSRRLTDICDLWETL